MKPWKVTITKEEIEKLFMLDETEFLKAVDILVDKLIESRERHLIIEYLKKREFKNNE